MREQVGTNEFEQQAGSFFQNNNSILPSLLDYIKEAVGVKPAESADPSKNKTYLVDAYCGSGLFAISLADQFDRIEGVEIDKASIKWAKKNADYNKGEGRGEIGFRDGKAEAIFGVSFRTLPYFLPIQFADTDDILFPPVRTSLSLPTKRRSSLIPLVKVATNSSSNNSSSSHPRRSSTSRVTQTLRPGISGTWSRRVRRRSKRREAVRRDTGLRARGQPTCSPKRIMPKESPS